MYERTECRFRRIFLIGRIVLPIASIVPWSKCTLSKELLAGKEVKSQSYGTFWLKGVLHLGSLHLKWLPKAATWLRNGERKVLVWLGLFEIINPNLHGDAPVKVLKKASSAPN